MSQPPPKKTDFKSTDAADPPIHTNVPRDWPTWPPTYTTTSQVAHRATGTAVTEPTPMQRWMNESSQQSPWNNIAAVAVGKDRYGEKKYCGDKGSTAGTWGSRSG